MDKVLDLKAIAEVVDFELRSLKYRIGENIKERKPISEASGKTRNGMRIEMDGMNGSLWGREDFDGLEKGNSPEVCKKHSLMMFEMIIYTWSIHKKIKPAWSEKQRMSWSYSVAKKLQEFGTRLYEDGGRKDIYTSEFDRTVKNITDRISLEIINTPLT